VSNYHIGAADPGTLLKTTVDDEDISCDPDTAAAR
jgi:hypothetical protein